ncbi:MAG: 16S rRNA (uracil(1498)-N(3))-methyltransferase [Cyclobacteriaceae bacterium]
MNVFYEKDVIRGQKSLSEEEAKHCSQVLRHKSGDEISILDGSGGIHHCVLDHVSKKSCTFEVKESIIIPARKFSIHLAIAPTKSTDRMEWMIEKLCEIGAEELTFLETHHSERRKLRIDRMEKKAISAMKQSKNPFLLKINELTGIEKFFQSDGADNKLIAHVDSANKYLAEQISASKRISILIGPEGDFSQKEITSAKEKGYIPVSLGNNTLRTETAGLVACCMINTVNKF